MWSAALMRYGSGKPSALKYSSALAARP